jgi:branched-chain amino acid transport system substrate-binding protein
LATNRKGNEVGRNASLVFGSSSAEEEVEMKRWLILALVLVASALMSAGCDGGGPRIKIVSSLPLTGSALGQSQTIVNSINMALDARGRQSGNYQIVYEAWDDASAARGMWDPDVEVKNAERAGADRTILVYLGPFNSGAASLSIPILNQAGLVMISPANTNPGLTKPGTGKADEPNKYYPTGVRNYTRVCPADDIQGAVGARWAKSLGFKSVFVLDDRQLYGKGIADVFAATAQQIGLKVLSREGLEEVSNYSNLAAKITAAQPDLVYFGGITANHPARVLQALRAAGWKGTFMGADGILEQAFIQEGGADAEGVYVTFNGLPLEELVRTSPEAQKWYEAYTAKFSAEPESYGAYGYEAAWVALAAIDRCVQAGTVTRQCVRDAIFATKDFRGILGQTWSFDANGDTTITTMSGNVVKDGDFEFVALLK